MEVSVSDFERQVFEMEQIRIVLRLPLYSKVPPYSFERAATGGLTVRDLRERRLTGLECEIVMGNGSCAMPHQLLSTVRDSYAN